MPQGIACWVEASAGVDHECTQAQSNTTWPYTELDHHPWLSIQRDSKVTYKDRSAPARVWREVYDGPKMQVVTEGIWENAAQGAAVKKQTLNHDSSFQKRFNMCGLRLEELLSVPRPLRALMLEA